MDKEYVRMYCKWKNVNEKIEQFRFKNPNYKVFNISFAGSGMGINCYVIFRLKNVSFN